MDLYILRLTLFIFLVLDYYDVGKNERILIEETCNILKPSVRPSFDAKDEGTETPSIASPLDSEIKSFQKKLCETLNRFTSKLGGKNCVGPAFSLVQNENRLRLVTLKLSVRGKRRPRGITAEIASNPSDDERFIKILTRMETALAEEHAPFQYLRGFTFLDGNLIHILKPNIRRHWTQTAAMNDADKIIGYLADAKGAK